MENMVNVTPLTVDPCALHVTPVVGPSRPNPPRTTATRSSQLASTPAAVLIGYFPHHTLQQLIFLPYAKQHELLHRAPLWGPSRSPALFTSMTAWWGELMMDHLSLRLQTRSAFLCDFSRKRVAAGASKVDNYSITEQNSPTPKRYPEEHFPLAATICNRAEDFACCRNSSQTEKTVLYCSMYKLFIVLVYL